MQSFTDFIDQFYLKNMNMDIQNYFIKFYDSTYHVFLKNNNYGLLSHEKIS